MYGVLLRKHGHRASRGLAWLEGIRCDLRLALRSLSREPSFGITVALVLALSIALNATAFRVLDAMLLRGYALVKDNDRLLYITEQSPSAGCCVSYFDFEHWRREAHAFQALAFMAPRSITLAEGDGDARTIWAFAWTANVFRLAGVVPALGRDFEPADTVPGAPPVVIANYRYWQSRLGGRLDIIGETVRINGAPATIVGVMPQGFDFPDKKDIWLPLVETPELHQRTLNGGEVYGRLALGATEAEARAELEAIDQRLAQEYPDSNRDVRPSVDNYRERLGFEGTLFYGSLWLGAWFVLCIACANVANLALARTQERTRELSTRMALGAGRYRLVRQLFLEHLLLATIAGLVAAWLSALGTKMWATATETLYSPHDYSSTRGTLVYLCAVTLGATVLITLAPMARLWRLDVNAVLKSESRSSTMDRRAKRLSTALVVGQVTLAVILIAGAGVLGRSVWNIVSADVGVKSPERVLIGNIALPRERYRTAESRLEFFDTLKGRLGSLPGVEVAALGNARPLDDFEPRAVEIENHATERYATPIFASGPDYFRAIGAAVISGRDFAAADRAGAPPVVLVNQRFADAYFPGRNVVGQRIRIYEKYHLEPDEWRTVVGVVSNVMQNESARQQFRPAAYLPLSQQPGESAWFFVRATTVWEGMAAAIRAKLHEMDPKLEIADYSTLKASLGFEFDSPRMGRLNNLAKNAVIAPIYAALALFLAAVGLYAVVARSVGRRRTEMGIRIALGATPREIRRLVLAEGMTPVAVGLVLGIVASLGVNRILQSQLVGVSPYDALTLSLAPLILITVALIGCLRPARMAVNVDPAVALRQD